MHRGMGVIVSDHMEMKKNIGADGVKRIVRGPGGNVI